MFDLSKLSAFIFDLDGVIWRGSTPVPGAIESVAQLRAAGKRCFYCTNNSRKSSADFAVALRGMGIEAEEEDIMTSSSATAMYISQQLTGDFSAYVVGEDGLISALRKVGARIVSDREAENIGNDVDNFPVDCVVAGIDRHFTYQKLSLAQRFILNGARFVATNRDTTFPVADGLAPGAGSIIAAIEAASGTTPTNIGKPQPLMMNLLLQKFGLSAEETAMIGDRLDTDIVAAHRAKIGAIYVATGISSIEEAQSARGELKPHAMFDDLPALCAALQLNSGQLLSIRSEPKSEAVSSSEAVAAADESAAEESAPQKTSQDNVFNLDDTAPVPDTGERLWESMNGSHHKKHKPPQS